MRLTNRWNRLVYGLWSPVYDSALGWFFRPGRERAHAVAAVRSGERVLLLGVGTGADLPLLPAGVRAVGIDLSEAMLERARARLPLPMREIVLQVGDAQAPAVEPGSFDVVMLELILSVVPDARACMREAVRAVRPGGRLVVFDKFLAEGEAPSVKRRVVNAVTTTFGTDVTRQFGALIAGLPCTVVADEPSILGGAYRVILVRRDS